MRLYGVPGRAILMVAMALAGGLAARAQTAAPAALALQLQPGTAPVEANGTVQFGYRKGRQLVDIRPTQ